MPWTVGSDRLPEVIIHTVRSSILNSDLAQNQTAQRKFIYLLTHLVWNTLHDSVTSDSQ